MISSGDLPQKGNPQINAEDLIVFLKNNCALTATETLPCCEGTGKHAKSTSFDSTSHCVSSWSFQPIWKIFVKTDHLPGSGYN